MSYWALITWTAWVCVVCTVYHGQASYLFNTCIHTVHAFPCNAPGLY